MKDNKLTKFIVVGIIIGVIIGTLSHDLFRWTTLGVIGGVIVWSIWRNFGKK